MATLASNRKKTWRVLGLGVSEARENFSPLPGVKAELESIVKRMNSAEGILSGTIKLNGLFTKEDFFPSISSGNYQVVHIASHYSFEPKNQTNSFLLVGNGRITFAEMGHQPNAFIGIDLLTLSACDTGTTGNGTEAEGFAIQSQSMGAKSVIASLWPVSDTGTPELMFRFYRLLAENPSMSKGEAFQGAQLSLLGAEQEFGKNSPANRGAKIVSPDGVGIGLPLFVKDAKKPFAHPHYWASFVLIGNWR